MLDSYKETQEIAYSLLVNSIKKDKLSHAYLINANNYDKCYDFVLSFVKTIVCDKHFTAGDNCANCSKCSRIDNGNYSELKIIEPVNGIIKKEQLLELQEQFSSSCMEGKYRIYIIKDCDKMNKYAANSLLKFLEEPFDNIIAILVTNNFSNVMTTITSRCQIINLLNVRVVDYDTTLENINAYLVKENIFDDVDSIDNYNILVSNVLTFIKYVEENGVDVLIYMKKMWYNNFSNRDDFSFAMVLIEYFYYDVLKFMNGIKSNYFFSDKLDDIAVVSNLNSINSIIKKLEVIDYVNEMVSYNLNLNLLIDDFVIRLGECNE